GPGRLAPIALGVSEVAKGPVDRVETVGAACTDHSNARKMPHVAGIAKRWIAGDAQPDALARRQISEAENQRFEARRGGGDFLDPRQGRALFDQSLEADPVLQALLDFNLGE